MGDSSYCIFRIREVQSKCAQSSWGGIFFTQLSQQESLRFGGGGSISAIRARKYSVMIGSISIFISVILCNSILNTVRVGISAPLMFFSMGNLRCVVKYLSGYLL